MYASSIQLVLALDKYAMFHTKNDHFVFIANISYNHIRAHFADWWVCSSALVYETDEYVRTFTKILYKTINIVSVSVTKKLVQSNYCWICNYFFFLPITRRTQTLSNQRERTSPKTRTLFVFNNNEQKKRQREKDVLSDPKLFYR